MADGCRTPLRRQTGRLPSSAPAPATPDGSKVCSSRLALPACGGEEQGPWPRLLGAGASSTPKWGAKPPLGAQGCSDPTGLHHFGAVPLPGPAGRIWPQDDPAAPRNNPAAGQHPQPIPLASVH